MSYPLAELARQFDLSLEAETNPDIRGVCGLSDNLPHHLSFITDKKLLTAAATSNITAFVCRAEHRVKGKPCLVADSPEYSIAQIAALFAPTRLTQATPISSSAIIDPSATLGDNIVIGANVVIGAHVHIGNNVQLYPNVVVMDRCGVGDNCIVYPNCTLREDTQLGQRVILQPGVSLGGDGYGFVHHQGQHKKIPQLGRVVLEDDVEVGANSTIDRARFSETRIGRGTKIDNLVMLAHNVKVGEDCLLVSQVGVSGSTTIGNRVTLAGQVGTVGHVTIGDDVTVLGKGGVTKDLREPGIFAGMPAKPVKLWLRAMARLYAGLK